MELSSVGFQSFLQPGCTLVSGCAIKLEVPQKLWAHSFPGQGGRVCDDGLLPFQVPLIITSLVSLFIEWWVKRGTFSPTHSTGFGTGNIPFSTMKPKPRCYWKCRQCNCGNKSNCSFKSLQLLITKKKQKSTILWVTTNISYRWNILLFKYKLLIMHSFIEILHKLYIYICMYIHIKLLCLYLVYNSFFVKI